MTDRLDEWKSEWVSGKMSDQLTWWINELWINKTGRQGPSIMRSNDTKIGYELMFA